MGKREVRFSDLSGQMADPAELASVVVEHPDLELPVRLEAMPAELEPLKKLAIKAVALEVQLPGDEEEPTRYVVTESNFAKLATVRPMAEVLASAEPVVAKPTRRSSHNRTSNGEPLRTFNTLENAGMPHQGKVSVEEARLVRENLEAVNANRAAQDLPPIDPANPVDAKRYGFGDGDA